MREPSAMPGTEPISRKPRMLQVDVAQLKWPMPERNVSGIACTMSVPTSRRRQRVIERSQRHDTDGAGPD